MFLLNVAGLFPSSVAMERIYTAGCEEYSSNVKDECLILSKMGSFGGPLFCFLTVLCGFLNQVVFSHSRLRHAYGPKYSNLSLRVQQHMRLLHVDIVMKLFAFPCMAIPMYMVNVRGCGWSDLFNACFTLSDMAALSTFCLVASIFFDLIYNDNLHGIYMAHHVGTVLMMQVTLTVIMALPTKAKAAITTTA